MPRNNDVYSPPSGTGGTPQTPISSSMFNAYVADITTDLNAARPIVAGGTGATTAQGAINALFSGGKTVNDDELLIADPSDNTKRVRLDAGSVTAGQTRVITAPDHDTKIISTGGDQTLTADEKEQARANLGLSYADAEDKATFRDNLGIPSAYWETKAIGELVALQDDLTGVSAPPTDNSAYRYIRLTAGDDYNDGVLTGESVSGSAPLVTATAVIDLDGSSLDGETVHLINTERRFLRAGSAGTVQNDALQNLTGEVGRSAAASQGLMVDGGAGVFAPGVSTTGGVQSATGSAKQISFDASRVARTDTETRGRNIGVTYYMRIK